jgi:phosphoglycolate phosphatase-like HAD superfamily hydrolase
MLQATQLLSFQCWCFDLDGTLLDIRQKFTSVHRDLIKSMGGRPVRGYIRKRHSGKSEREIFLLTGLSENRFEEYDNSRERMLEEGRYLSYDHVFRGTRPLFSYLRSNDLAIWIITHRSNKEAAWQELTNLRLDELIVGWICTRTIQNNDFRALSSDWHMTAITEKSQELSKLREKYGNIVMVGDSPSDIKAAKTVGASSIALPTGLFSRESLLETKPDFLFDNMAALARNIKHANK